MGLLRLVLFSEITGKAFIMIGLVGELVLKAPFYLTLITTGALLISIGAELRAYKK